MTEAKAAQTNEAPAQHVTKDMTIGDVVSKYPQITSVLMGYGLHCVGCHVSGIESLEDGAMGHGMTAAEVDQMIADINKAIDEGVSADDPSGPLVTVTESAVNKVRDLAVKEDKEGWQLKVFVMPGGCSGFKYGLDFIEKPENDDIFIEQHGMKVYIEKDSVQFIKGAVIDYIETLNDVGFKITNPNASRTCGCGSSFS